MVTVTFLFVERKANHLSLLSWGWHGSQKPWDSGHRARGAPHSRRFSSCPNTQGTEEAGTPASLVLTAVPMHCPHWKRTIWHQLMLVSCLLRVSWYQRHPLCGQSNNLSSSKTALNPAQSGNVNSTNNTTTQILSLYPRTGWSCAGPLLTHLA